MKNGGWRGASVKQIWPHNSIFRKWWTAAALLLIAGSGIFYYVEAGRLTERLKRAIGSVAPGSQVTWSYAIPVPLLNRAYCGNIRVSRPDEGTGSKEYLEIRSLIVSKEDSPKDGEHAGLGHFQVSLEGVKGSMRGGELTAERLTANLIYGKIADGNRGEVSRLDFPTGEIEGLYVKSPSGRTMHARRIQASTLSMLVESGLSVAISSKTGTWETLLQQEVRCGAIKAESVIFTPTKKIHPVLTANYLLQGSSGPGGVHFSLQAGVIKEEKKDARPEGHASLKDRFKAGLGGVAKKAGKSTVLVGAGSSLRLEAAIPWREPDKEIDCSLTVTSPGFFILEAKMTVPSSGITQGAAWADTCLQLEPPFFDEIGRCGRELGFSRIDMRLIDRGIVERAAMAYAGAQMFMGALSSRGSPENYGTGMLGFLLLCGAVLQREDTQGFGEMLLQVEDVDGMIHPLRPDLKERFDKGLVRLDVKKIIPGPDLEKIKSGWPTGNGTNP